MASNKLSTMARPAIGFDNDGTKGPSKDLVESHIIGTSNVFFDTPSCADKDNCEQVMEIKISIGGS